MNNDARADQASYVDESKDRSYFVITPQIVWALCQDPFELALWTVIKMVAGEDGQCTLSGVQLGKLAMMSEGKAIACRQRLMDLGLLEGRIRRDPGYPQPIWHLRIPDLWERNLAWRRDHNLLIDRIEFKHQQWLDRKESSPPEGSQEPSGGEDFPSPGEDFPSPGEGMPSPGAMKEEPSRRTILDPKGELATLWKKAQEWIQTGMPESSYQTWIAPARMLFCEGTNGTRAVVIESPNVFGTEWLRNRLDVVIRRAIAGQLDLGEDQIRVTYITA